MQVPGGFPAQTGEAELTDRRAERDVLDRLLDAVRGGESRALVVHGEPGTGKTVLLEYLAERLSPDSFVRIHRSRIVNLEAVAAFERHDEKRVRARLTNGTTVVASRAWSSALRNEAT